ncbi:MAG: hypothetical protein IJI22_02180 [Bacilli bacterium]|nr:hypothetical protein [Bacilli bacterium]
MKNKKKVIALVLAVALVVAAVGTTLAWLTAKNEIKNTFTVGTFTEPTTDPEDATESLFNENDELKSGTLDGNLYEKSWDSSADHQLIPGVEFVKDPYIGIGPGSEDGVVYLYVENNLSNKVYFTINTGWEAVANETTAGSVAGTYTSGLFKYTAGLTGSASADSWTSDPLFSKVVVSADANTADFTPATPGEDPTITVKSFIHQAKDAGGNPIDSATILTAAKEAFELA